MFEKQFACAVDRSGRWRESEPYNPYRNTTAMRYKKTGRRKAQTVPERKKKNNNTEHVLGGALLPCGHRCSLTAPNLGYCQNDRPGSGFTVSINSPERVVCRASA
ncbi:putative ABC transporter substrate binding protein [Anopheles sinensis]|uniref:Putative ABC transporter substrate binding protein n=1 Tax=Anopheles sinensis TaxID=74873 RepID=A0A084VZI9_ANOSI|nr:putative ABC transporter substrate binding protein [Anopheles sinensis]